MIRDNCIHSADPQDGFVGVRFKEGTPEVVFPHGFHISDTDKDCRKDIFRLLAVLKRFTEHSEGDKAENEEESISNFPLFSYQFVVQDFLAHGYYTEKEVKYVESLKGKINWKRTIQQENPQIDGDNVVYLNFQVKTNKINENNLITKIHQYCVYQSFLRFGWLFFSSEYLPPAPSFKVNKRLFVSVLTQQLGSTYNDYKKKLFQSMLDIVNDADDSIEIQNLSLGVNKFAGIWQNLIDYVFGEPGKEKYYPHATWHIIRDGNAEQASPLMPDTIMKYDGKIYVLDAKYYRYGITEIPGNLPQTDSIQKQITYGKHIVENFSKEVKDNQVYSAFMMPFDSKGGERYKFVSIGTADWEKYTKGTLNYAYILGLLIDTKWLITEYVKHDQSQIDHLADLIEQSLSDYRKKVGQ